MSAAQYFILLSAVYFAPNMTPRGRLAVGALCIAASLYFFAVGAIK